MHQLPNCTCAHKISLRGKCWLIREWFVGPEKSFHVDNFGSFDPHRGIKKVKLLFLQLDRLVVYSNHPVVLIFVSPKSFQTIRY